VAIGRGDPACQAGLMGVVDLGQGHCAAPERGTWAFWKPAQQSS
jgi:hypothetical protein